MSGLSPKRNGYNVTFRLPIDGQKEKIPRRDSSIVKGINALTSVLMVYIRLVPVMTGGSIYNFAVILFQICDLDHKFSFEY